MYGYQLKVKINQVLETKESTIYGILKKIELNGLCNTYLQDSKDGAARKYYKINKKGQQELNTFIKEWTEFSNKINNFFEITNGENIDEFISEKA